MKKTPLLILLALLPALPAAAADAGFTLGIPRAPKIRNTIFSYFRSFHHFFSI